MRSGWAALGLVVLAACAPEIPDSRLGVGFDRVGREQGGETVFLPPAGVISTETIATPQSIGPPQASGEVAAPTHISDEQDFAAVSSRETIQSDAERLAQARAAYVQVQPGALPARPGESDTLVIDFALSTTNAVGAQIYRRGRTSQERFYRACARYGSQDAAQEAFLKAGGPAEDFAGVDPDGDGFACFWDPTPFRNARLGAVAPPVAREVLPGGL